MRYEQKYHAEVCEAGEGVKVKRATRGRRVYLRKVRFRIFDGVALFDDNLLQVRDDPHNVIKVGAIFIISAGKLEDRGPVSRGE